MPFVVCTMTCHSDLYSCGTISWILRRINDKATYGNNAKTITLSAHKLKF